MFNKFIKTSAVAAALVLGGTAFAQTGSGSQTDQMQPQQGTQQQGVQSGQQGTQGSQGSQQGVQGQGTQSDLGQQSAQQGASGQQSMNQGQQQGQGQALKSVKLSALDQNQIKEVQTQLKDLGFYKGAVDGVLGNGTRTALISYFTNEVSLVRQGRIADNSLQAFGFNQGDIERVRGLEQQNGNVRQNTQGQDMNQQQNQKPLNQGQIQNKDKSNSGGNINNGGGSQSNP